MFKVELVSVQITRTFEVTKLFKLWTKSTGFSFLYIIRTKSKIVKPLLTLPNKRVLRIHLSSLPLLYIGVPSQLLGMRFEVRAEQHEAIHIRPKASMDMKRDSWVCTRADVYWEHLNRVCSFWVDEPLTKVIYLVRRGSRPTLRLANEQSSMSLADLNFTPVDK